MQTRVSPKIILSVIGVFALAAVLGAAVWRVSNSQTILKLPKAAGSCAPCGSYTTLNTCSAAQTSGCSCSWYSTCDTCAATGNDVNVVCRGNYEAGTCSGNPYCGQTGEDRCLAADCGSTDNATLTVTAVVTPVNECETCAGSTGKSCASGLTCKTAPNAGPDQGGVCVKTDGTTVCGSTSCTSDNGCMAPLVCAGGKCSDPAGTHLGCANNSCVRMAGAGNNLNNCAAVGGACSSVTTSNEADSCWGNNGTNGRCYDCNGDGTVNVLDFACFRLKYGMGIPQ